jgi:pyrroline-5-carboxylate reductase
MHIVLAGFGNMGRALATGWLEADSLAGHITIVDPDPGALRRAGSLGLNAVANTADIEAAIDVAVLAVKPAAIDRLLAGLPPAGLYISIAAGRTIAGIERHVGEQAAIVRAMPNTPAAIGQGVTGLCANANVSSGAKQTADRLLAAVGTVEWLEDESDMDALTAVSGSGPAYVFLLIECLTAAAIDAGLEPALAERLAKATVKGAGAYAGQSEVDAATLRQQVTSPNGTTAAALRVLLENDALPTLIRSAVLAAARRSRELGST